MKRKIFLISAKLLFLMTVFLSFAPKNVFGQAFLVGENEYTSLSEAINAANTNETPITLLQGYTVGDDENLPSLKQSLNLKGFTLNLNGKALSFGNNEITITGTGKDAEDNPTHGKITSSSSTVINSTSELHLKDVTIETTNTTEDDYVYLININNSAKITLYEGTVITGGNDYITPFRTYNYSNDKTIAFVDEDCEIVGDEDYVLDYGEYGLNFTNSEGQFCGKTLTVQKAEYFEASYGTEKKIFGTLERALTADYGDVNDVTVTLKHNYRRNFNYFDKTHVDAGDNTIKYIEPRYNFTLDFTPASILDTLAVKINGKTLTINGDGSTNLYAHFELENGATLNINGGNYDFYNAIVHINSDCSATISSSNTNFVTLSEGNDASGLRSCIPFNTYYDYIINDGGNLTINDGTFSYKENENLPSANRDAGRGVYTTNNGTTEIKDGTFTGFASKQPDGSAWKYISFHPAYISDGTINISGGTFSGSDCGLYSAGIASAEITDGEFSGLDYGININQSDYDNENQKDRFVIKGGTFKGTDNGGIGIYAGELGSAEISGGTFTGKQYGISSYMSHISLSGGTFSGDEAAVNIDYDNYNANLLNEGYAYYAKGSDNKYSILLEEKYSENDPYNLLDADNQAVKDVKVDKAKIIFTLGKGAKYNFDNSAGNTFDPITNSDGKTLITATQESGKWYVNTTEYVVDGSTYTLKAKEDENVTIEVRIKDYFKGVLEKTWYRSIEIGSDYITEYVGHYEGKYGLTNQISTNIDTELEIYGNGETTDENNYWVYIDGDGKKEVTLELKDDKGNVYALKKRTVNFDNYKPSVTIECDGVAVPKVSSHEYNNPNEVVILPTSTISFKFDDSKDNEGNTLTGDKISGFERIVYIYDEEDNEGQLQSTNHFFTDSTTAATGIEATALAGKTVEYLACDQAGNSWDYGDSLKVTFVLAKFKATYKENGKDVVKYFGSLRAALTSNNYPTTVTDIAIEPIDDISANTKADIEVENKNFTFSLGDKTFSDEYSIVVKSGKLTITGGTFGGYIQDETQTNADWPIFTTDGGTLEITGGTFNNSVGSAILVNSGTLKISGGTFHGTNGYGINYTGGKVELSSTVNAQGEETAYPTFSGNSGTIYNSPHENVLVSGYAFYDEDGKELYAINDDGSINLEPLSQSDILEFGKVTVKKATLIIEPSSIIVGKGAKYNINIYNETENTAFDPVKDGDKTLITVTQESGKWYVNTTENVVDGSTYTLTAKDDENAAIKIQVVKDYYDELFDNLRNDGWYNEDITINPAVKNANNSTYDISVRYGNIPTLNNITAQTAYTDLEIFIDGTKLESGKTFSNPLNAIKIEYKDSKGNVLATSNRTLKIETNPPSVSMKETTSGKEIPIIYVENGTITDANEYEVFEDTEVTITFDDTQNGTITDEKQISGVWQIRYKVDESEYITESTSSVTIKASDFKGKNLLYFGIDKAGNFSETMVVTFKIAEKITADDIAALLNLTKEYDGGIYVNSKSNVPMYTGGSPVSLAYKGIFLNFSSTGIVYDSKDAGDKKKITATLTQVKYSDNINNIIYVVDGATAGKDFVISQDGGEITAKPITVTEGITAENKIYDGSTVATLNFTNAVINGVLSGDENPELTATGTFENANAGADKPVTISNITISGTSNYTVAENGNQTTTTANITAKEIKLPSITIQTDFDYVYNGEEKTPSITIKDEDGVEVDLNEFTVSYRNNTQAGEATIVISDKDGGNYIMEKDHAFNFTIQKADPVFTKEPETTSTGLPYTGEAQPLVTVEGETSDGEIFYRLGEDGEYSKDIPTALLPGNYTIYYKITGDDNHKDSEEKSFTVRILQQETSYVLGRNAEVKLPFTEVAEYTTDNNNVTVENNVLKTNNNVSDGDKAVLTSEKYIINVSVVEPLKTIEFDDVWHNDDVHLKAPDLTEFGEGYDFYINGHKVENIDDEVITEEGENNVVYEVKDPEENVICHEERVIKIDKTAPETVAEASSSTKVRYHIEVSVDGDINYFFRQGAEAEFDVKDKYSGVKSTEYSWDNKNDFQPLDLATLVGLKSGIHTFFVRVTDNAGNSEILSADFTVFEDSKFSNGKDTVISLPVYYGSEEISEQSFDLNLNSNTIFAIRDSKGASFFGNKTDGVYFENGVLTITNSYLSTLKPSDENKLYVYINPMGKEAWNQDFTPKDYESQTMTVILDIIYEVRVNADYKFTAPNDNTITTFCNGEDVLLTFSLDKRYSPADFISIATMGVLNEKLTGSLTFTVPKGALKGGNEPIEVTFSKDNYTANDTVTFPGDYPSEFNIKVYDDVLAIDNSQGRFLDNQYQWFIDMTAIEGETKQFLDLLKYMTDGKTHTFSATVVDISGSNFRVCPDEGFTIESIGKRKAALVNVYPNPAQSNQNFFVELTDFDPEVYDRTEIIIYNQLGTIVTRITDVEKINSLSLKEGFYSGAVLVSGKKVLNFKIIVK